MFHASEIPALREVIRQATMGERHVLDRLRSEVRVLKNEVRPIRPRTTTSVSLVASDGGNHKLEFDPFHLQLVRVVDSYGEQLCLDAVTPTTDTDRLSRAQFCDRGSPVTSLGRLITDLKVDPPTLNALSQMIPDGKTIRERPDDVSPTWVLVYRDLCEWAALYERLCYRNAVTDTIFVRDGLLRSKMFRGELFMRLCERLIDAIAKARDTTRRRLYVVGLAKHSKVLARYRLAMALERTLPRGSPRYVHVPRELEANAYVWPEYARGVESRDADTEAPKYVGGDMFFVRFGPRSNDPIWTVDLLSGQMDSADEAFGYLLADASDGFPIPLYPRCLSKGTRICGDRGIRLRYPPR